MSKFIDLENPKNTDYEIYPVNTDVYIKKLTNDKNSKIRVHLTNGLVLSPNLSYADIKK